MSTGQHNLFSRRKTINTEGSSSPNFIGAIVQQQVSDEDFTNILSGAMHFK